jgi:hypothetical protein
MLTTDTIVLISDRFEANSNPLEFNYLSFGRHAPPSPNGLPGVQTKADGMDSLWLCDQQGFARTIYRLAIPT